MDNSENKMKHVPVLYKEILDFLIPEKGACRVVDGTLGYGGHSSLMLEKNNDVQLLGIDRDSNAIAFAKKILNPFEGRFFLKKGCFSEIAEKADEIGWSSVDAILLDIGVSSPQIDEPKRGFSHRFNGPLDMRMDRDSGERTAAEILNYAPLDELIEIFRFYGEIKSARRLATAIVERRGTNPWFNTKELVELCEDIMPKPRKGSLPVPTLCFQALRIAVNGELDELEWALESAVPLLAPGGRIAVISYHSLEDRIVKNFFRTEASTCVCPPGLPVCICDHEKTLNILTKKPVQATEEERDINRRSGSAKMRVAEKV